MHEKCEKDGRGNLRTDRQVLGLRKATPAVLGFIWATRSGQRTQKQEEDMRKRERVKHEEWSLVENRLEGDEEVGEGEDQREGSKRVGEEEGGLQNMNRIGSNEQREDVITN